MLVNLFFIQRISYKNPHASFTVYINVVVNFKGNSLSKCMAVEQNQLFCTFYEILIQLVLSHSNFYCHFVLNFALIFTEVCYIARDIANA